MDDSIDVSFCDWDIEDVVADECGIARERAQRVCKMFEDGCEVPFVARYRVVQTGHMSCDEVRSAHEAYKHAKTLREKLFKAANTIQAKVDPAEFVVAAESLRLVRDVADLASITSAFVGKRSTTSKAAKAKQLGLEPYVKDLFEGEVVDFASLINGKDLKRQADVTAHASNLLADLINKHPKTLDAVKHISRFETKVFATIECGLSAKAKKLKPGDKLFDQIAHFQQYKEFHCPAHSIRDYQILALNRGEEREILSWKIEFKDAHFKHPLFKHRVASTHQHLYEAAFNDSMTRLFLPKLQRAMRKFLTTRAEQAAIVCFSKNLRQLFSQESFTGHHIIALDPGYNACKSAFISPKGEVIDTFECSFSNYKFTSQGIQHFVEWCSQAEHVVFAVGNGCASRETQHALAKLIREKTFGAGIKFCVVPETGASKYSVTPLAEEELPNLKPTVRSAVSIGRRLLDPMAEYVKIEPQHLGLGMYQHSVPEKKLAEALQTAVREAVSLRGVDLNSASKELLQQVCGLNKATAAAIVAMRNQRYFINRQQLKEVKGIGDKAFEQCAGFLLIRANSNGPAAPSDISEPAAKKRKIKNNVALSEPLDATIVHPTQYGVAKKLLLAAQLQVDDLRREVNRSKLAAVRCETEEERAVLDLLVAREELTKPPELLTEIRNLASLRVGERFQGRVNNVVDFGIFVDIGVDSNGLVHRSVAPTPPPPVGSSILVVITKIDVAAKRFSLHPV